MKNITHKEQVLILLYDWKRDIPALREVFCVRSGGCGPSSSTWFAHTDNGTVIVRFPSYAPPPEWQGWLEDFLRDVTKANGAPCRVDLILDSIESTCYSA